MTDINRDDLRAAVSSGILDEAQAASLMSLSQTRSGARSHMSGLDEPFELFRGFNEVFIVVGLCILYSGWTGITGVTLFSNGGGETTLFVMGLLSMGAVALLARYFTLKRRMVAPSIALSVMFGLSALQAGYGLSAFFDGNDSISFAVASVFATLCLVAYYRLFRVPFTMAMIAVGVFATTIAFFFLGGATPSNPLDYIRISSQGSFGLVTFALGIIGLIVALRFDMSDPHRISRRSQTGFWLHVIAAPAIVNTVALTLFSMDSVIAQLVLVAFLAIIAAFAIIIDRRSFLISAVGYVVALSATVIEDAAFFAILLLGLGLVLLGAKWEAIRRSIMNSLPGFPGKSKLPPWDGRLSEETIG